MTSTSRTQHDPLTSTFCFSEGIGLGTEQRLWRQGVLHWDDLSRVTSSPIGVERTRTLRHAVENARRDLEAERAHFARDGLTNSEMWRIFPRFRKRCAYLDIETTGLYSDSDITLIGIYDGERLKILQRGKNLDEFPALMRNYSMITTFNGRCFDVPFLQREFPSWQPTQAHWDLRWAFQKVGHRGGLKDIEREMRVHRPGPLAGLDGFDAVTLWYAHKGGDRDALPILRRYLAEDVMGLAPLAERAFNLIAEKHPLSVAELPASARPECDLEYDARAIRRILRR